ncbi:type II/IV secretion system protein [Candidatus Parcubacteria bacterium]|nr:MAG: type II/IV secretion system protein [Candidatus Parcubacteria bacterium]
MYKFVPPDTGEITGKVEIERKHLEELRDRLKTFGDVEKELNQVDFKRLATTALLETVLAGAISTRASDVHFEAEEKRAKVRFRIDGLLHDIFGKIPLRNYGSLVSRIKLLSGMKINVYGEPQDGRFTITLGGKEIEMRVSVIPSEFGETIVMRVLDPGATAVDLRDLGLREDDLAIVERNLAKPNGLILNTGPTGSGKTTTLYAFLRKLNDPESKVITIEDPIEYRIEGIEQTQVDPGANYTFARGLRAIVRQDPDVILVGEIRDLETADIAMQAALTGHLVLSTLHTNDAVGAVPRLVNLGVKPSTIGPALSLVIAQRLVRKLCGACRKETKQTPDIREKVKKFLASLPSKVDRAKYPLGKLYKPVGCPECNGFGYRGRVGVFEFLESGPRFEELVLKEASEVALKRIAKEQEMVTMQEDGVLKALLGLTDLEEVERVTGALAW